MVSPVGSWLWNCLTFMSSTVYIVAIDMSPAQNALLEIKLAAIRHLQYHDYLCLLGEKVADSR